MDTHKHALYTSWKDEVIVPRYLHVIETRKTKHHTRRRVQCRRCGFRFTDIRPFQRNG